MEPSLKPAIEECLTSIKNSEPEVSNINSNSCRIVMDTISATLQDQDLNSEKSPQMKNAKLFLETHILAMKNEVNKSAAL